MMCDRCARTEATKVAEGNALSNLRILADSPGRVFPLCDACAVRVSQLFEPDDPGLSPVRPIGPDELATFAIQEVLDS